MMARERYEMVTGEDAPRRSESTVTEELDGEAVVYAESTGDVHALNATATLIWQQLDGHVTLNELARDLSELFTVPFDLVQADVLQVVRTFAEDGLLDASAAGQAQASAHGLTTAGGAASSPMSGFLPKPPPG